MKKLGFIVLFLQVSLFTYAQQLNYHWVNQLKGAGISKVPKDLCVDAHENIVTVGYFEGTVDFDPTSAVNNLTANGAYNDIYIQKTGEDGNVLWTKQLGGTYVDEAYAVCTDDSNNVYVLGVYGTTMDADPGSGTYLLPTLSWGITTLYLLKLDPTGNFVWAKTVGSDTAGARATAMVMDEEANIYIGGKCGYNIDLDPGPEDSVVDNSTQFILKLDRNGQFIFAQGFGFQGGGIISDIALDNKNSIYFSGNYSQTADFDPGPGTFILTSVAFTFDAFICKVDSLGQFRWAYGYGAGGTDGADRLVVDDSAHVYIYGTYADPSTDFDPGPGVFTANDGYSYILKLDSTMQFIWFRQFESVSHSAGVHVGDLKIGAGGSLYLSGDFNLTIDFNPGLGVDTAAAPPYTDAGFLTKLNLDGNYFWTHFLMGKPFYGTSIPIFDVNTNGDIYFTGGFRDTVDFDPGPGLEEKVSSSGSSDLFLAKWGICAPNVHQQGHVLNATTTGATYQWVDCNNAYTPIIGATGQSFTATANGTYAAIITINGCTDTSSCFVVSNVGIQENGVHLFSLYPNPSKGILNLQLNRTYEYIYVRFSDITGKVIFNRFEKDTELIQLNINTSPGIYFLEAEINGYKEVFKVIIN